jgi:uncharacterized protein (TIGR00106 family)
MFMSVLLEFAMFPTSDNCREGSSVSKQVAKIVDAIDRSGVKYQLTPMGTIIETDTMSEALDVIALAYEQVKECERVYSSLKFDIRHNSEDRLKNKIKSVENNLGRKIQK